MTSLHRVVVALALMSSAAFADATVPNTLGTRGRTGTTVSACRARLEAARIAAARENPVFEHMKFHATYATASVEDNGKLVAMLGVLPLEGDMTGRPGPDRWFTDFEVNIQGKRTLHRARVHRGRWAIVRALETAPSAAALLVRTFEPALDACLAMDGIP